MTDDARVESELSHEDMAAMLTPGAIDEMSIRTDTYAGETLGLYFEALGRHWHIYDRDDDGLVESVWSYGNGPEWCADHPSLPTDVYELLKERDDVLQPAFDGIAPEVNCNV